MSDSLTAELKLLAHSAENFLAEENLIIKHIFSLIVADGNYTLKKSSHGVELLALSLHIARVNAPHILLSKLLALSEKVTDNLSSNTTMNE